MQILARRGCRADGAGDLECGSGGDGGSRRVGHHVVPAALVGGACGPDPGRRPTLAAHEIDSLAPLWDEFLSQEQAASCPWPPRHRRARARARWSPRAGGRRARRRPTYRVVVADVDGGPVGFASCPSSTGVCCRRARPSWSTSSTSAARQPQARRRHALLREAARFADEVGAGDVVVNVPPSAARRQPLLRPTRLRAHGRTPVRPDRPAAPPARRRAPARPPRRHDRPDARAAVAAPTRAADAAPRRTSLTPRRSAARTVAQQAGDAGRAQARGPSSSTITTS